MRKFIIVAIFFALYQQTMATSADTLVRRRFWCTYTYGTSMAAVDGLQTWAASEGVRGISATSRNRFIGFDLLYHSRKLIYGLSMQFELPDLVRTEPYYASFAFRTGYTFWSNNGLELKGLAGMGAGFAFIRFRGEVPSSLEQLHATFDDPFGRVSLLTGRLEGMITYELPTKRRHTNALSLRPVVVLNAGVTPTLAHGHWQYGETIVEIVDGNTFNGERVDIPKFYRANWFLSVGLGVAIGR